MRSIELLPALEEIPLLRKNRDHYKWPTFADYLSKTQSDLFAVEVAVGIESVMAPLFDRLNVSDDLLNAYRLAFSDVAATVALHERYLEMAQRGPESVTGFVNSLKGKLAELRMSEELQDEFPGYSFTIASDPTQPDWDIMAVGPDEIAIQVKVGGPDYAGEVVDRMELAPDVLFAVSAEIHSKILEHHPELQAQLADISLTNLALTAEVEEDLELLAENSGWDFPDAVGGVIPYVAESLAAIKLVCDIVKTEKDLAGIEQKDRNRVHVMKAVMLFSRLGVVKVCTVAGAAAGSIVDPVTGIGTAFGGIAGAVTAWRISKELRPRMIEIAMWATQVGEDELFYYRNKNPIDEIGRSLAATDLTG